MDSAFFLAELQQWLAPADTALRWLSLHAYSHNYLFIAAALYLSGFCVIGARMASATLVSTMTFGSCRQFFASPRPYWSHPELFQGVVEKAWGMPSGHSQNAMVFWGISAWSIGRVLFLVMAIAMVICIAVSRLYLGVHYPGQVIIGLLLGFSILLLWVKLETQALKWLSSFANTQQVLLIILFTSLPLLITLILREGLVLGTGNGSSIPYKYLIFYTGLLNSTGVSLWLAFKFCSFTSAICSLQLILTRTVPGLVVAMLLWHFRFACLQWFTSHGILYALLWLHGVAIASWTALLCPLLQQKLIATNTRRGELKTVLQPALHALIALKTKSIKIKSING